MLRSLGLTFLTLSGSLSRPSPPLVCSLHHCCPSSTGRASLSPLSKQRCLPGGHHEPGVRHVHERAPLERRNAQRRHRDQKKRTAAQPPLPPPLPEAASVQAPDLRGASELVCSGHRAWDPGPAFSWGSGAAALQNSSSSVLRGGVLLRLLRERCVVVFATTLLLQSYFFTPGPGASARTPSWMAVSCP